MPTCLMIGPRAAVYSKLSLLQSLFHSPESLAMSLGKICLLKGHEWPKPKPNATIIITPDVSLHFLHYIIIL
jgi:hypothetical protein